MNFLGCTPPFLFYNISVKMLSFEDFFHLKRPLLTTDSEKPALTSRKHVAEVIKNNPKRSKPYELLWWHLLVFALETFTCQILFAGYYQKNILPGNMKQVNTFQNNHKTINYFVFPLLYFCFRIIASKILNFHDFFKPKWTIYGYYQWNACTHFQK